MPRRSHSVYRATTPGRVSFVAPAVSGFAALEASTNELIAERTRRMQGATIGVASPRAQNRWYRIPTPDGICPPLGPLALAWQDIFDTAKANLLTLVALRPAPRTPGVDVVRWCRCVRWNIILLLDATNIRPVFRWPVDYNCADFPGSGPGGVVTCAEATFGVTNTLAIDIDGVVYDGMPYPGGSGLLGIGAPLAAQRVLRDPAYWAWFRVNPVWLTALDCASAAYFSPDPLGQHPGDLPGAVLDLDPTNEPVLAPVALEPSWAACIDKYWSNGGAPYEALRRDGRTLMLDANALIDTHAQIAAAYGALDLQMMLLESIGWYVHNHLPYWRRKGPMALDEGKIATLQRQVQSAQMRQALAPASLVGSLTSSVNPIAGAVVGLITEIGFSLLDAFLGTALSGGTIPQRLFIRNYPPSCLGVADSEYTLDDEERALQQGLTVREAQAQWEAEAEAAAALREEQARLADSPGGRDARRRDAPVPWVEIGLGVAAAVGLGFGLKALLRK